MTSVDVLRAAVERLGLSDVLSLRKEFLNVKSAQKCFDSRACPLKHLEKAFSFPLTLLAAMFDTGCVLTGPRALEFFHPCPVQGESWDFYVPGFKESVADMVNALSLSGVTWELEGDRINSKLQDEGRVKVEAKTLEAMDSWVQDLKPDDTISILGLELHKALRTFRLWRAHGSSPGDKYVMIRRDGEIKFVLLDSELEDGDTSIAETPSLMTGHISVGNRQERVRLFIGQAHSGVGGLLRFMKLTYNIRLHCFVGGWCASHIDHRNNVYAGVCPPALRRCEPQGFDSGQSLYIDYGDVYRPWLGNINLSLLDFWLEERRESVNSTKWTTLGENLILMHQSLNSERKHRPYAQKEYAPSVGRFRRLADILRSCNGEMQSHPIVCPSYSSSVRRTLAGDSWHLETVARSGHVFGPLPDAAHLCELI